MACVRTAFPFRGRALSAVVAALLLLATAACGPVYKTQYDYAPPPSPDGPQCVASCNQSRGQCDAQCYQRQRQCEARAETEAEQDYLVALEEWRVEGQVRMTGLAGAARDAELARLNEIKPRRSSYRGSTSHCKADCGCEVQYNACYRRCGGTVREHRVCTAFCD